MSRVTVEFILNEEVTPELFAGKVAIACAKNGALREGEAVRVEDSGARDLTPAQNRYPNHYIFWRWHRVDVFGNDKMIVTVPDIEYKVLD